MLLCTIFHIFDISFVQIKQTTNYINIFNASNKFSYKTFTSGERYLDIACTCHIATTDVLLSLSDYVQHNSNNCTIIFINMKGKLHTLKLLRCKHIIMQSIIFTYWNYDFTPHYSVYWFTLSVMLYFQFYNNITNEENKTLHTCFLSRHLNNSQTNYNPIKYTKLSYMCTIHMTKFCPWIISYFGPI